METIKLSQWSYHRQFLGKQGTNAVRVLKEIAGVYSWHPSAPLSLWNRLSTFSKNVFNELDKKRSAIRIPAMRLSNYMLEQEKAPLIFAAMIPEPSNPYWEKRYTQKGRYIDPEKYPLWKEQILANAREPKSLAEIRDICAEIPDKLFKIIINRMAFEGYLLRVGSENMRSNIIKYVAAKAWIGQNLGGYNPQKALKELAVDYLHAFGPERIKDFQWWSGVTMTKARHAMSSVETIDIGDGYLLLSKDIDEFESFHPEGNEQIDLLPQWDSYIMGYAPDGRERFVNPDKQELLYGKIGATGGNGLGTILVNGIAHGSWNAKFKGSLMSVQQKMFEKPSSKLNEAIKWKFSEMASFMEIAKLTFLDS